MKIVIVASTDGSVLNELLNNEYFKSQIHSIVSDRDCKAVKKAEQHRIPIHKINEKDKFLFCNGLMNYLEANEIDYVISFFTKLFVGNILSVFENRIINLHPSLLPSFKGMDGFGDTVRYGARYIGSTIHFIDDKMDEGKIILQTVYPLSPDRPLSETRHRIFEQQCKSLLQVVKWLGDGRISINGKMVIINNAKYDDIEFSPNLDFDQALDLSIPYVPFEFSIKQ